MQIRIDQTNYPNATTEPTGWQFVFPPVTLLAYSYNVGTDELTVEIQVTPTATYTFWHQGKKFTKTDAGDSVVISTPTDGMYSVYYDSTGTLIGVPFSGGFEFFTDVPIALLWWDAIDKRMIIFCDMRFGTPVSGEQINSTVFDYPGVIETGDALSVSLTNNAGTGGNDTEVQWYISYAYGGFVSFMLHDVIMFVAAEDGCPEELRKSTAPNTPPFHAEVPILWVDNTGTFHKIDATAYPIHYDGTGLGAMHYNNVAGSTTAPAPDGSYVAMFIVAKFDPTEPYSVLMGQRYDTSLDAARQNNTIGNMAGDLTPLTQYVARIIYHIGTGWTNVGKAVAVLNEKLSSHFDFDAAITQVNMARMNAITVVTTSPYNMTGNEGTIIGDVALTNPAMYINLPLANLYPGRKYTVKRQHNNTVVYNIKVTPQSGEYIDDKAYMWLAGEDAVQFVSDGVGWHGLLRPTLGQVTAGADGGASAPAAGIIGDPLIKGNWKIVGWTIISNVAGNIVFEVMTSAHGSFPGGLSSITGSAKPTMVVGDGRIKESTTLTGWTLNLFDGSIMEFSVVSADTLTKAQLTLHLERA